MTDINKIIHDIRNPLNNISMNTELAKLLIENGGDRDKLLETVNTVLKECRHCGELLDQYRLENDST